MHINPPPPSSLMLLSRVQSLSLQPPTSNAAPLNTRALTSLLFPAGFFLKKRKKKKALTSELVNEVSFLFLLAHRLKIPYLLCFCFIFFFKENKVYCTSRASSLSTTKRSTEPAGSAFAWRQGVGDRITPPRKHRVSLRQRKLEPGKKG